MSLSEKVATASMRNDTWAAASGPLETPVNNRIVRTIAAMDYEYPKGISDIALAPAAINVIGDIQSLSETPIAIVGTRNPSQKGTDAAFGLAADLAARGHSIISGLAEGIDAAAHKGALSNNGHTVAVIGTGPDVSYPRSNAALQDLIASQGAVISQFDFGQPPSKTTFPARNALIAALSSASVVIESQERSGTKIESNITLEQKKPVFLWGPILGQVHWAQRYAQHPDVHFAYSPDDILKKL